MYPACCIVAMHLYHDDKLYTNSSAVLSWFCFYAVWCQAFRMTVIPMRTLCVVVFHALYMLLASNHL